MRRAQNDPLKRFKDCVLLDGKLFEVVDDPRHLREEGEVTLGGVLALWWSPERVSGPTPIQDRASPRAVWSPNGDATGQVRGSERTPNG